MHMHKFETYLTYLHKTFICAHVCTHTQCTHKLNTQVRYKIGEICMLVDKLPVKHSVRMIKPSILKT